MAQSDTYFSQIELKDGTVLNGIFMLAREKDYSFLWVNEFPLLEYDEQEGRFYAKHHPFTMPNQEDLDDFFSGNVERLKKVRAIAYDGVCNGHEVCGGSIRIHDQNIQKQMFKTLGLTEEETKRQFGFFIEALNFGTPPHGGVAFGLDRLVMIIAGTDNIRDVIAFPKTTSATDLMAGAPSIVEQAQLDELHLNWKKKS